MFKKKSLFFSESVWKIVGLRTGRESVGKFWILIDIHSYNASTNPNSPPILSLGRNDMMGNLIIRVHSPSNCCRHDGFDLFGIQSPNSLVWPSTLFKDPQISQSSKLSTVLPLLFMLIRTNQLSTLFYGNYLLIYLNKNMKPPHIMACFALGVHHLVLKIDYYLI